MKENYSGKATDVRLLKSLDYIALSDSVDFFRGQSIVNITVYWDSLDGNVDINISERQSNRIPVWTDTPGTEITIGSDAGSKIFKIINTGSAEYSIKAIKGTATSGNIYFAVHGDESPFVSSPTESPLPVEVDGPIEVFGAVTVDGDVLVTIDPSTPVTTITDESDKGDLGLSAAQLIEKAMDKSESMPIQVQLPRDLKQAPDGGLMLPMSAPYIWNSSTILQPLIIDCTGYQSVIVQKTTAGIVTPTVSNDGINYVACLAIPISTSIPAATMPTAANVYIVPVVARYLKLTGPASVVNCTVYLSQTPCTVLLNTSVNIAQFGGTAVVTGGVAGLQGVGGNIAPGVTPTANPVPMGGVDDNRIGLTRRFRTDDMGRMQVATSGDNGDINELGFSKDYFNRLAVQEMGRIDGDSQLDVLQKILIELRVLNQQIFELPRLIDEGRASNDDPCSLRDEGDISCL